MDFSSISIVSSPIPITLINCRPIELFSQISLLSPKMFTYPSEFGLRYCNGKKVTLGGRGSHYDFSGSSNMEELRLLLEGPEEEGGGVRMCPPQETLAMSGPPKRKQQKSAESAELNPNWNWDEWIIIIFSS